MRLRARLIAHAVAGLDRAVTLAVRVGSPGPENEDAPTGHEARVRLLTQIVERYAALDTSGYFPVPRQIDPALTPAGSLRGMTRLDLGWPSVEPTFLPELAERYGRVAENRLAVGRLLSRGRERPVAILVHGYMMGRLTFEERIWPIGELDARGLDIAFTVLPFHGRRADPRRSGRPEFPGRDPRIANEGFRQAVTDLRELALYLRSRGHSAVGAMGMSLGGYTVALAATVDSTLDFVVPVIPLASLADFAREQGEFPDAPETRALEHGLHEASLAIVSPVHRTPLVAPERMLVLGGKADRITPLSHARRLATHFRAPLATLPGSHLVHLGRASGYERVFELLEKLGITSRSR
jgi:pimeloyl-ACP methyl ester carboxylesterase